MAGDSGMGVKAAGSMGQGFIGMRGRLAGAVAEAS